MNKYIIKHFGSISSFILSIVSVLICLVGLYISFCVDNMIGNIILFLSLLTMALALKD